MAKPMKTLSDANLVLALGLAATGCTVGRSADAIDPSDLAWPREGARVALERVIDAQSVGRKGKVLRWITGRARPEVFHRPYGVAWDGDSLLVTDPAAGRVIRVSPRGRIEESPGGALDGPIGVAVCPAGIVVTDSRTGHVSLLDRNLRPVRRIAEHLERPTGVACGEDRVFVVETGRHRVLVLEPGDLGDDDPEGEQSSLGGRGEGPGEFNFPAAIALNDGSLWVGDTLNFRIQRLDATLGGFLGDFGSLGDSPGEMPRIKGLSIDASGHIWVSDAHLDQVSLYRPDGTFLMDLGRRGSQAGEFSFPAGIAAHTDGRVAVVDSLNRRVQIFRLVTPRSVEAG
jgi:DNA-binding beta-propeller fold protein YncE